MDFIAVLKKLLLAQAKQIGTKIDEYSDSQEILNIAESISETVSIADTVTGYIDHNRQNETVSMNETFTAQSLDYEIMFVAGPYAPLGKKRVFIIDGSRLG
jgi:hypothetical protein